MLKSQLWSNFSLHFEIETPKNSCYQKPEIHGRCTEKLFPVHITKLQTMDKKIDKNRQNRLSNANHLRKQKNNTLKKAIEPRFINENLSHTL